MDQPTCPRGHTLHLSTGEGSGCPPPVPCHAYHGSDMSLRHAWGGWAPPAEPWARQPGRLPGPWPRSGLGVKTTPRRTEQNRALRRRKASGGSPKSTDRIETDRSSLSLSLSRRSVLGRLDGGGTPLHHGVLRLSGCRAYATSGRTKKGLQQKGL